MGSLGESLASTGGLLPGRSAFLSALLAVSPAARATSSQRALLDTYARGDRGALECAERDFHGDGQKRDQQGSGEQAVVLLEREPVHDVPAETAERDQRPEGRGGHHVDRRGPDPPEDQRKREWELDHTEHSRFAEAHATAG